MTNYDELVASALSINDLQSVDWSRQTDIVKQIHTAAAMICSAPEKAIFVDGRISTDLIQQAISTGDVKNFFNQRLHKTEAANWSRLIYFETPSTRRMGVKKRGRSNLHFHALFVLPERKSNKQIRDVLSAVFGKAPKIPNQFYIKAPNWTEASSFKGKQVSGPLGKLIYLMKGTGASYNDLNLNNGKRQRKVPVERRAYNKNARGFAQGIPSNFNSKLVLCDRSSLQQGRRSFVEWVKAQRGQQQANLKKATIQLEMAAQIALAS